MATAGPAPPPQPAVASERSAVAMTGVTARDIKVDVTQNITRRCERPLAAPREAPQPPAYFTGRDRLIDSLKVFLLDEVDDTVTVLYGMGGIGKTTLAGVVARLPEVEERFSDGTFWIDLQATDPMTALDRIACTFGHDISNQTTLNSRALATRSILRHKKVLIVLDNAWQVEEVSPLLPHTPTACALVTTRDEKLANDLSGEVVQVTTLTETEGAGFLLRLIGGATAAAAESMDACREMASILGHLPLALELAGKRIRKETRKAWFSWPDTLAGLREEKERLSLGAKENTVRATFNLSYERGLDAEARALFNWLGLLAAEDLALGAIARVAERTEPAAAKTLSDLADLSLIQQISATQYRLHPLLHDFAREKFSELDERVRVEGYQRASDYFYEQSPEQGRRPKGIRQVLPDPKSIEEIRPVLRSHHYAVAARDRERARRVYPWFGTTTIRGFLKQHGYPYTLLQMTEAELGLAGNDAEVAAAERAVGEDYSEVGRYQEAITHLTRALDLYRKQDHDVMVAKLSYILAQAYENAGDVREAINCFEQALEIDRKLGDTRGEGLVLTQIGDCYRALGEVGRAGEYYETAREFCEREGCLREEAIALIRLSEMRSQTDPAQAIRHLDRAASLDTAIREARLGSGEPVRVMSTAFEGWDGARLLCQIGNLYKQLLFNEETVLEGAVSCFRRAIEMARAANSRLYEGSALYGLGNLLEHLFLVPGLEADYAGAIACYELADRLTQGMELPAGINPRERIETRIKPRLEADEFNALVESARSDPDPMIQSSIQRILGEG